MEIVAGTYNGWLVLLSYAVAVASSYTVVTLIGRLGFRRDRLRLFSSSFIISIGLWSFHYIAMMSYRLPLPVHHNTPYFFLSIVVPFCTTFTAAGYFAANPTSLARLAASGIVMGSGVFAMHYIGMQAMQVHAFVQYDPFWVAVSWAAAALDAFVAFWLSYRLRHKGPLWRAACSSVMGLGIVTVHYVGMYGTTFRVESTAASAMNVSMHDLFFASAVGIAVLFLFGSAVMTVLTNRRLREAEQGYASLFEESPDMVLTVDTEGRIVRSNSKTIAIAGYEPDELTGRSLVEFICPDELEAGRESFRKTMAGKGHELEIGVVHRSGKRVFLRATSIPLIVDGVLRGVCVIAKDITADRRMKEQLRRLTEWHETILNTMVEGVYGIDAECRTVFWNKAAETMTGYSLDELFGHEAHPFIHHTRKDGTPLMKRDCPIYDALERRSQCRISDDLFWRKDGTCFPVEYTVNPIAGGGPAAAIVTFRDITARKRHEDALTRSEAQYRTLVEHLPDALIVVQEDKRVFANDTAVRMLGASRKEDVLEGDAFANLVPVSEAGRPALPASSDEDGRPPQTREHKLLRPDGQHRDVEVVSFGAWYEGARARYMLVRDVTELKQARELIQRSEKLSVAGELAAGIAHEIRNPLTAIKGFIQLLKGRIAHDYYDVILSEIGRIELITGELLMLSKPQAIAFQPKNVTVLLDHVATLLETQAIMRNVQIVRMYESPTFVVSCDENQIKQVFINMLKNSIEAMPDGGTVTIEAKAEGNEVRVVVRDEGTGIPEEKIRLLGQPFYTTKEKGTGLGLMISLNIVENHGGRVQVFSRLGAGTEIHVHLPLSRVSSSQPVPAFPIA
ncbi:PAS domain S-box protein [Paenibacillus flagellatus]|nr:PAS domain S-box protein [Paenibacillus flagellatus]